MLDNVGVGQSMSYFPFIYGWNKLCIVLFFIGGFRSWIDKILLLLLFGTDFSSFLTLLLFLKLPCFLTWWVGVLLFGDNDEESFSIDYIAVGFVMYIVFFDFYFCSVEKRFDW